MRLLVARVVFALAFAVLGATPAAANEFRGGAFGLGLSAARPPDLGDAPPASVVLIQGALGSRVGYGCGVIVADRRSSIVILTAAHNLVMQRPDLITVNGEWLRIHATTILVGHDLALIEADRPDGAFAVAQLAPQPAPGNRVRVWGPIEDRPFTLHDGVVRPLDPRVTGVPDGAFAIDCADCDHGDSGTGIFDDRGRLLGVVTSGYFEKKRKLFVLAERAMPIAWQQEQPVPTP